MKMDVVLTRSEFEAAILAALNIYNKAEIDSLYLRPDGGIECTVRTIEEPSRNPTDVEQGPVDLSTPGVTRLWTPDPPPFIHSVEAAPVLEARPWKELDADWWPPIDDKGVERLSVTLCDCGRFSVYPEHGWVANGNLHTKEHCEGVEVEAEPPAISDAAALSASSTGEHGTVESSDEDRIPF